MGGFGSGHGSGGVREGAGRPKGKSRAGTNIMLRVSVKEKAEFQRRAQLAGLSVTEYIKVKAIGGIDCGA